MDHNHALRRVRITASDRKAVVEIDGKRIDAEAFSAYSITQLSGEEAHLVLHLADQENTRFDGLARVSVAVDPDPGPAAAVFLEAINAGELERVALARIDLGTGPHSLTQAMLTQLQEWARGV